MDAVPPFIVHDRYEENKRSGYVIYDFTLLRLSSRVRFSSYPNIRPICLPSNRFQDYDEETAGVVAGWGFTRIRHITIGDLMRGLGSFASDTLQKLSVRFSDYLFWGSSFIYFYFSGWWSRLSARIFTEMLKMLPCRLETSICVLPLLWGIPVRGTVGGLSWSGVMGKRIMSSKH